MLESISQISAIWVVLSWIVLFLLFFELMYRKYRKFSMYKLFSWEWLEEVDNYKLVLWSLSVWFVTYVIITEFIFRGPLVLMFDRFDIWAWICIIVSSLLNASLASGLKRSSFNKKSYEILSSRQKALIKINFGINFFLGCFLAYSAVKYQSVTVSIFINFIFRIIDTIIIPNILISCLQPEDRTPSALKKYFFGT